MFERFQAGIVDGLEYVKFIYAQLEVSKLDMLQDAGYTYQFALETVKVELSFSSSVK